MTAQKLKYAFEVFLYHLYIRKTHPGKNTKVSYNLYTPLSEEDWQDLNRLVEMSGVKDKKILLGYSVGLFEKIITHELKGGTVELIEPNKVDSAELNLLEYINGKSDEWEDE